MRPPADKSAVAAVPDNSCRRPADAAIVIALHKIHREGIISANISAIRRRVKPGNLFVPAAVLYIFICLIQAAGLHAHFL